ncbi:MAG: stage III sporulation AC/AD family protein [Ruminococcus sp.]|nr:stage III sporulation AC/AD family protein [Ruminococcus sp.]
MVESCFTVAVFCVVSAIIAVLLRQYSREQSLMAALAASCAVGGACIVLLSTFIGELGDMFTAAGVSDAYISLIFKAAAVCFITQLTCDICRDSGETAIASAAEMWGRAAVTFMSLPVLSALLEKITELIQGGQV